MKFYCNADFGWGNETIAIFDLKREAKEFCFDHNSQLENKRGQCKIEYAMYINGERLSEGDAKKVLENIDSLNEI